MLKRIASSEFYLSSMGFLLANHYKLVGLTNSVVQVPQTDFYQPFENNPACIIALWHGEHFLFPFFGWNMDKLNILMTTHRDGEILARGCGHFGLKVIRGSGDHGKEFMRKKAVQAFANMLRALKQGESVVMTADVPKIARVAGLGVVTLAKYAPVPDHTARDGDQPALPHEELGPHLHQPAVRPHGHGARRADPGRASCRRGGA